MKTMNITVKNLPRGQAEIKIELTPEEYRPFLEMAAKALSEVSSIPGFRPGHVSYDQLKQRLGEAKIWEEALEPAVKKTLVKAIDEKGLKTIGAPRVDVEVLAPGNPVIYKAIMNLLPEVTLSDLSSTSVAKKLIEVSEAQVDKTIEDLRKMRRSETLEKRPAQLGDKVEVDFDILLDKVPIEDGAQKKFPLILGEGMSIPGFEEQLIGLQANDIKEFELNIPETHPHKMIAGKNPSFKVKMIGVFKLTLPELTDEYVQTLGPFNTVAGLREEIKKNLLTEAERDEQMRLEDELVTQLVEKSTFGDVPDLLVDSETKKMLAELEQQLGQRGIPLADYLIHLKKTREQILLDFTPQAIKRIKSALVMRQVSHDQKISASEEEVDAELAKLRQTYQSQPQVVEQLNSPDYAEYLRNIITSRKVIGWLKAVVVK